MIRRRGRRPLRRAPILATLWTTLAFAAAPASAEVLISNMGQTQGFGTTYSGNDFAQGFTTGSNAGGYTLSDIEVRFGGSVAPPSNLVVGLASGVSTSNGGSTVRLSNPAMLSAGVLTFTPASATTLSANATYFVIVEGNAGAGSSELAQTSSTGEDAGGQAGFSIDNNQFYRTRGSTGGWVNDTGGMMMIRVNGEAAARNPTVTIAAGTSPVTEGTAATFTVTSNAAAPSAGLTVNLSVAESSDGDYVATSDEGDKTVTISSGQTTATYSVTTQNDSVDETNGSVTVTVKTGTGYTVGSANSATVNVNDDDVTDTAPSVSSAAVVGDKLTITFNEALAAAANLNNDAFAVKKTPHGGTETGVGLSTSTGPSISGSTVVLTLASAVVPRDTNVKVSYTKPGTGIDNKIKDSADLATDSFSDQAVTNNTVPTLTIAGGSAVTEGTAATFTITAHAASASNITVNLTVADVSGSDFVAAANEGSQTVTLNANSTSVTYSVATVGDTTEETSGNVTATLAAGTGYTVGSANSAGVTVNDDDGDTAPVFSSAAVVGDKLTITFNEALAAAANLNNDAFAVKKTPHGGTETGVGLSTSTGPSISGSTVVLTLASAVVPRDTNVKVSYTKPGTGIDNKIKDSADLATDSFSDQAVTNNTVPTLTIAGGSAVTEGTAATFTITAHAASASNITVNLTVADVSGSDFVAAANEGSQTVTLNANSTSVTYSVATVGDTTEETSGNVTATLAAGTGYTVGSANSAGVTVNDDDGANNAPVFTSQPTTGTVDENSADNTAVMTGNPAVALTITATDADAGDSITYTLDDESDKLFDISSSGAITVKVESGSALDHEGSGGSITVTVTAGDGTDTADHEVTITIADVEEAPAAPAAPDVEGASSTSVTVTWTAPTNTGPAINDYDVQYKLSTATAWTAHSFTGAGTSTTISGLSPSTTYNVQVMAKSPEGDSGWSATGSGATSANAAPVFTSQPTTATVPENSADNTAVMTGVTPVALTVTATDADAGDTISYTLNTEAAKLFAIDSDGAITVDVAGGSALDHEGSGGSITVTVTATDDHGATDTHAVTVTIADVAEPPAAPAQPTVSAASSTSVTVSWTAPDNTGPAINDYDVRYKVSTATDWTDHGFTGTGISTTISGLSPSTTYNVQVRAGNAEGAVNWSPTGSGATAANAAPVFSSQPTTATVPENSADNTAVMTGVTPVALTVTATDANAADTITYSLDSESTKLFDIDSDGAITVDVADDAALDHEATGGAVTATVTATDDHGATATHAVTITIEDEEEPPAAPAAPTVTGASISSLSVNWTAPTNTGPPITTYAVRYRNPARQPDDQPLAWVSHSATLTGTSTTITGLDAVTTYIVQVQATNAEGTGGWSPDGRGKTHDLTISIAAGTSPVTEGTAAEFTLTASPAPAADLTVTVRVTEKAGSDFVAAANQGALTVTIPSGATTATYSVPTQNDSTDEPDGSVTVDLGGGTDYLIGSPNTATVQVNDNDDPPANPPVFTNQPTTATVPENSTDGTAVQTGDPASDLTVTATDADGDALTYSLDSASDEVFDIDSDGAITVQVEEDSALDHEALEEGSITVTVTASDGTGTASHEVTVSVTDQLEPPGAPDEPTVAAASATSVTVTWTAPDNAGKPDIDGYNVQYRVSGATAWTAHSFTGTGTTTTIAGLTASTTYEVQVQASNDEGDSDFSATGSGDTGDADNIAPVFTSPPGSLDIAENSAGGTIVGTVAATDADSGDTLSYSLDSASGAVFDIDSGGVITVESGATLDYEDTPAYAAVVTVNDGTVDVTHSLTINVTDEDEPPEAPGAPTVTAVSPTSVNVSWTAPDTADRPDITDYDVRYKLSAETDWTGHDFIGTGTATLIAGLTPEATYDVQVQAFNADGASGWSATGSGATSANNAPVFTDQAATASVAENSPDDTEVATITATDEDTGDTIAYSLDSDSDAVFDIDPFSGAITVQVESGSALDHEATPSYTVTVTATDGTGATATHDVTVSVTDELEPPDAPAAPTVTGTSPTSVDVIWTAPDTTGRPAITDYDVRYRASGDADWIDAEYDGVATTTTISSLTGGTTYEVQVQAKNDEGESGWSETGTGSPGNSAPVFTDQATTATVAENSADGTPVVTITATDADVGDTITYSLDSTSDEVFDIDSSSGAITVQVDAGSVLDHESTPSYTATVTATDSSGTTATHDVTVSVTDELEPPDAPAAPTVAAASSTSVTVRWTAPDTTGKPPITGYEVRFRLSTATGWNDHSFTGTGTRTTISSLTAGATYHVQVRAKNAEGDSGWSATGSGSPSENPLVLEGSRVIGSTVTLEFSRNLDATSVPDPEDFTVTVTGGDAALAGSSRIPDSVSAQQGTHRVTAVSIRGSVLELTVSPPVRIGQTVSLSYTRGAQPLRGEDGQEVADFTVTPTNETPANRAPTAEAGVDVTVASGAAVTLDGSASADPEGDALTFSWIQMSGVAVTLEGADTAEASFTAPAQPGALSFRLTVSDPGGLTAEDTVTVTVSDDAPDFGSVQVAALSLDQGRAIEPLVLPAASGGNGTLSYSLTSSPAGLAGLAFDPSTRALSGPPQATGSYVFTYRVEDADANRTDADAASLTFQVTVSMTADRKRVLTRTLGGMGQHLLSNAMDNIGPRFAEPAGGNRATAAGGSLADGPEAGAVQMAWGRPGSIAGGNTTLLGAGVIGGGPAGACAAGGLDPRAFAFGGVASCGGWASHGAPAIEGLLQRSDFSWRLGAGSGGSPQGARWSLWGRGDLGMFEGRPDSGSGYDGEARTGWLGVDTRAGPWVAGVALSRGISEADYHFGSGESQMGRLEIELTAVYPYARRAFANGLELKGVFGAGSGDARHFPGRGDPEDAGLKMRLGSLGMRGPMPSMAGLEINARADLGFVRMETGDGAEALHGLRADVWRGRFGLEASRRLQWGLGCELVPYVEVAGRKDSGDGLEGTGVEVAGGWRYRDRRWEVEGRGRVLVQHSADGADERGVSLTARLLPRANGTGMSLALTPSWGATAGSAEALWRNETPWLAGNAGVDAALLDAQAGYGFILPGGLLTPFVETNLAGADYRVLRMGVRFEAARMNLQTELQAERFESVNAQLDHGLRLDLKMVF